MRSTIKDVAREAGVSVATVSRVFNDSGPVMPATREQILAVARQLRYSPNGVARSLTMRRTSTLGVLLPDLHGEYLSEMIRGVEQEAQQHRYHLLLSSSHNDEHGFSVALQAMRGRVDGLIIMSSAVSATALKAYLPEGLPMVLLNSQTEGDGFDAISIDNYGGAYAMTAHLIDQGRRRIGMITGPVRNHDGIERLRGFRAALRDHGIPPTDELEIAGNFTEQSGHAAAERLLQISPRITAIFSANDSMAIGAISAVREAGCRVPEDVAIAGFDDIPTSRYLSPPLSSVQVSIHELGTRAMGRLLQALRDRNHEPFEETLPVRIVVRASTGGASME